MNDNTNKNSCQEKRDGRQLVDPMTFFDKKDLQEPMTFFDRKDLIDPMTPVDPSEKRGEFDRDRFC